MKSVDMGQEDDDKEKCFIDYAMIQHGYTLEEWDEFDEDIEEDMEQRRSLVAHTFFCDFNNLARAFRKSEILTIPTNWKGE